VGIVIAILFIFISIGGLIGVIVYWRHKVGQYTYTKFDRSEEAGIDNTQSLLPFEKIEVNRVHLGNHRYVAFLKVEPFNYVIRSEEGKGAFAVNLRSAINGFDFRFNMFTHTRKMVNDKMLKKLSESMEEIVSAHPDISEYANEYFRHLSVINVRDPSTGELRRVKDYYIVIPWEPKIDEAGMTDLELEYRATEEIRRRLTQVSEGFKQAGISTKLLNTVEIIGLYTSIYRREESNLPEELFANSYTSVMVSGDEETHEVSEIVRFSAIIEGAMNRLGDEMINNPKISSVNRSNAEKVMEALANINRQIKGQ
jgi:hypothetical protein cdifQCD-7_19242